MALLNPEVIARILERLRFGCYLETAAVSAGLSRTSLYRYLKAGRAALEQRTIGVELAGEDKILADFTEAVDQAIADAESTMVERLSAAGLKDWRADLAHLERRFSDRYGPRQRPTEDLSKLTNDELLRRIDEEKARMIAMGETAPADEGKPGSS